MTGDTDLQAGASGAHGPACESHGRASLGPAGAGWYRRHVAPYLVHCGCSLGRITEQRRRVVPQAAGVVLELGIGSGLNAPHYDAAKVRHVIGVDPDPTLLALGRRRIQAAPVAIELVRGAGEDLPLENDAVDTALVTYTLCSIAEPEPALEELRRVLKPNGRLLFCEHGRSHKPYTALWQDRLTPLWRRIAAGCHLNRNVSRLIANAGFRLVSVDTFVLPLTPAVLGFHHLGMARAR